MRISAPAPSWEAEWGLALRDLELDVARAESMLRDLHAGTASDVASVPPAWQPPAGLGPLPETLLERAQQVHAHQLRVTSDIAAAMVRSGRDLQVARRLEGAPAPSRPMFVDAAF